MTKRMIVCVGVASFILGAAVSGWGLYPPTVFMPDASAAMRDLDIVRWDFSDVRPMPISFVFVERGRETVLIDITAPEQIDAVYLQHYPFPAFEKHMLMAIRDADGAVSSTEAPNPFAPGKAVNPRFERTSGEYVILASKRDDSDTFFAFREYDPDRSIASQIRSPNQPSATWTLGSSTRQGRTFSAHRSSASKE